ncbi:GNAT family N-acetyltransferase [Spirosoma oryzicola]|uniref:GNAT family N-acetyltransferase n=1 Tax=Spirosoma oryzicola TaxID=2898794 RepID=UPI001E50DE81|nr:GNAT family N-acetyltransferase [Spirosoma oryzicola]UHG90946.1 GNAT family N-acetyltransferase [Spirosoma oryzicola]
MSYLIDQAQPSERVPMHLLLLADENQQLVEAYLPLSQVYLLKDLDQVVGICLLQIQQSTGEIMNIAVEPAHQGKGFGKALLAHVTDAARQQGLERLVIKTGNSSIGQMALYQQHGFDLIHVNYDYFTRNYPNPIWENRIRCKHQLIFELSL